MALLQMGKKPFIAAEAIVNPLVQKQNSDRILICHVIYPLDDVVNCFFMNVSRYICRSISEKWLMRICVDCV